MVFTNFMCLPLTGDHEGYTFCTTMWTISLEYTHLYLLSCCHGHQLVIDFGQKNLLLEKNVC